jgi:hypothetical protein
VVYEIQSLAGFSAVVDRLGQFAEAAEGVRGGGSGKAGTATGEAAGEAAGGVAPLAEPATANGAAAAATAAGAPEPAPGSGIAFIHLPAPAAAAAAGGVSGAAAPLLELRGVSVTTPDGATRLTQGLDLEVRGWGGA